MSIDKVYMIWGGDSDDLHLEGVYTSGEEALMAAGVLNYERKETYQVTHADISSSPSLPDRELIMTYTRNLEYKNEEGLRSHPTYGDGQWEAGHLYSLSIPLVVPKGFLYRTHVYSNAIKVEARSEEVLNEAIEVLLEQLNGDIIVELEDMEVIK